MDVQTFSEILARPVADRQAAHAVSSAAWLGWEDSDAENIRQVSAWMRDELAEEWADVDEGDVQRVAYWLISLRDFFVARGLYERRDTTDGLVGGDRILARRGPDAGAELDRPTRQGRARRSLTLMQRLTVGVWLLRRVLGNLIVWVSQLAPVRGFRA